MAAATWRRLGWCALAVAVAALLIWQLVNAGAGTPDPTAPSEHLSRLAVIVDSGILVLREGLETILVLAVLTASMRGGNSAYRKPLVLGGAAALGAAVVTWFIAIAITDAVGQSSLDLQAATGLLAIAVLLVVMNWFFHKVYWTGWIASHNRRRKALMGEAGSVSAQRTMLGLALLGFTSVYREGFEVVLFLQNLRLRYGSGVVLEGVVVGLVFVAAIGWLTFGLQRKLPYRRMLVATGVLLGVVLLVMVGESVQELQQAGWIGTTPINVNIPGWLGLWFSVFPNVQTIVAQVVAAVLVVGSYFLAEELRVRRPRRRGEQVAMRPSTPPPMTVAAPASVAPARKPMATALHE
ncbi:MAG TPA: FTR1 family protein [Solirubrobacteraceae bacterium]|nr:FTR1 family protein [Solirubrobacteraceae bacterium]